MMEGNCECPHHWCAKVLVVLAWVAAFGFWWAAAFKQSFLWMDANHFFKDVLIFAVLIYVSKYCGCCGMGGGMCEHGRGCSCGDCGICK